MSITKYKGVEFESSTGLTEQFSQFYRAYVREVKKLLGRDAYDFRFRRGHFEIYAHLKNKETGHWAYLSVSDVRYWPGAWNTNILVRSAKNERDCTGGPNQYTSLANLKEAIERITCKA